MRVSLDTNVWIFGILGADPFCETILLNLIKFEIIIPNQIRIELERNLPSQMLDQFYAIIGQLGIVLNYEKVPESYIQDFEKKGLKKGDAVIGGFAEWQKVDVIVSDNRDFLRGLAAGHSFQVMSPEEFCHAFEP